MTEGFSNAGGGNYVRVTRGRFLIKDENGDFELVDDEGKSKRFRSFDTFKGSLIGIDHESGKFGPQWVVKLRAGTVVYSMSFQRGNLTAQGLLNALANIDNYQNLAIKAWSKDGKKTTRTQLYVEKGGEQIEWKYQIEEMPAVPELRDENGDVILENGKAKLNTKERCKFFDVIIAQINKRLGYVQGVDEETGEISDEGFVEELETSGMQQADEAKVAKQTADVDF